MHQQPISGTRAWTAISRARTPSEREDARRLLARVADLDAYVSSANNSPQTLLMRAASKGNATAVDLLLDAGAAVDVRTFVPGEGRHTALFFAIDPNESQSVKPAAREEVVRRLICAGADPTEPDVWASACAQSAETALLLLESGRAPKAARGATVFDAVLLAVGYDIDSGRRQDWDAVIARLGELGASPAQAPTGRRSPLKRLRPHLEEDVFPVVQDLWERYRIAAELGAAMPESHSSPARRHRL